ncbi:MAG: LTA synthase family protein [Alistipes sp.]
MRRRILFLFVTFFSTVLFLALQKPVFLAYYPVQACEATVAEWWQVVWHGLKLDLTVAGYVTVLPLLLVLVSLWLTASERRWRTIFNLYFAVISTIIALIFAVDLALYAHWGFRIDGTILIYLADPKAALGTIEVGQGLAQTLFFGLYAGVMIVGYRWVVPLFCGDPIRYRVLWSLCVLFLGGVLFLPIRGGVGASVANISKVYFSTNMFLNHAATNPVFSLLSTLGTNEDYAVAYPFFEEPVRAAKFETLRGNIVSEHPSERVLNTERPNVVIIILESFGRTVVDAKVNGEAVMPQMQRLKNEGIWFENFFANSFRTDRGEVAILNGFPAQTRISIMKLPAKNRHLPSLAHSLGRAGYTADFVYGGDLNFTNQASYMFATGWQQLTWQKDLSFDVEQAKWGWPDDVMTDYFADRVLAQSAAGTPFLSGLLTLSSHPPFDVPYAKFEDKVLNSMAFSDDCVGRMIAKLKASPAWNNLLVVLVADHTYPYPYDIAYNIPQSHHIPMLWLGGAVTKPRVVETYASQIDICATVLAQMGLDHADYPYSKDIFSPAPPRKFGYYTFTDGFGIIDPDGEYIYDCTSHTALSNTNPSLEEVGKTLLQTTYVDISKR